MAEIEFDVLLCMHATPMVILSRTLDIFNPKLACVGFSVGLLFLRKNITAVSLCLKFNMTDFSLYLFSIDTYFLFQLCFWLVLLIVLLILGKNIFCVDHELE